jgi:hypothetical protein
MTEKIIFPEEMVGEDSRPFQRLMALVPDKDRADIKLKRFLVFRMKIDGEEPTRDLLIKGIEQAGESDFNGTLYEFLMDHEAAISGDDMEGPGLPPDESG